MERSTAEFKRPPERQICDAVINGITIYILNLYNLEMSCKMANRDAVPQISLHELKMGQERKKVWI